MNIRRDPIYVGSNTWRALRLIAKAQSAPEEGRISTADELADAMLWEAIKTRSPQLIDHVKAIEKMEREIVKTL